MHPRDVLIHSLEMGTQLIVPMLEDLRDAPLEGTLPEGGNHAHWILGHLLLSEAQMARVFAMGEENPHSHLNEQFQGGSRPDPKGEGYPSYDELFTQFLAERVHTVELLKKLSVEDLSAPPAIVSAGYEEFFPNRAAVFNVNANHPFMHRGQLADIRRRLGREILMY